MEKLSLVFLTYWVPGHLASMVEMAKRLLQHSGDRFSATFLIVDSPIPDPTSPIRSIKSAAASAGLDIRFQDLPPVEPPAEFDGPEHFVFQYFESYKPHVKAAIAGLSSSDVSCPAVAALVLDMFAFTMIEVAEELAVPSYVYCTSNALFLALLLHLPVINEKILVELEDNVQDEIIDLPGVCSVPLLSIPDSFMKKKRAAYYFLHCGRRLAEAKGIIVNTFVELEPKPLKAIQEQHSEAPFVYPVGPVVALTDGTGDAKQHECIKWLDEQPPASVVFLCFGSMGSFDAPQVLEVAAGLERSGHRFLWCLRKPAYLGNIRISIDTNLEEVLPEGFLERTRGRGLVWPSSVPQKEILAHRAVAGFVTHCGWNSVLESLWFGVPMLGWPLYAEQHLNALAMAGDMGVAVELEVDRKAGNFVPAEELEKGVRRLMESCGEGERVREKVERMRMASMEALEKGGSSCASLERLVEEMCRGVSPTTNH